MIKKIITNFIILSLIMNGLLISSVANAQEYQCTITIDANKNDGFNPAFLSSGCDGSYAEGRYTSQGFYLGGGGNRKFVTNGEIVDLGLNKVKVITIPLKTESKPAPKPTPPSPPKKEEPKKEQPKPTTPPKKEQPKQSTASQPKKEQPKQTTSNPSSTKQESKPVQAKKEEAVKATSTKKDEGLKENDEKAIEKEDSFNKEDTAEELADEEVNEESQEIDKDQDKQLAVKKNEQTELEKQKSLFPFIMVSLVVLLIGGFVLYKLKLQKRKN